MKWRRGATMFPHVLAAVFGCFGAWIAVDQYRFESSGVSAKARVVEHETLNTTDKYGRPIQLPVDVLEFITASGRTIRFNDVGTRNDEHRAIGEQTEIFYPASAPEHARPAGASTAACLIAFGFCLVFLALAKFQPRSGPALQRSGSDCAEGGVSNIRRAIELSVTSSQTRLTDIHAKSGGARKPPHSRSTSATNRSTV